ncbi:MAG: hypothetical protein GF408_05790 [Candidatus Omnitrophica bacterium]|nr:hypothetical protein [Candidatus Omnitrophota bacterium]
MQSDLNDILDCKNRKLDINGNCLEMLDTCRAMCCGMFNIDITPGERISGKYEYEAFCLISGRVCEDESSACPNRKYRLKKRSDGYCVHLDEDSRKCSIYEDRPQACRDFNCKGGWKIGFDFSEADRKLEMKLEELSDDMVFMLNPLIGVKGVFYSEARQEVSYQFRPVRGCFDTIEKEKIREAGLNSKVLADIIGSFDGNRTLGEVFGALSDTQVSREAVDRVVWSLLKCSIIVFKHPGGMA